MDLAYDHIQEDSFPKEDEGPSSQNRADQQNNTLNADFQEAYRAFSSSPWGAKIGGFFGNVVKQGESVYKEASQELAAVGQDATTGLTSLRDTLISRTRSLSLATAPQPAAASKGAATAETSEKDKETTPAKDISSEEALKESETVLSRLRLEAAKRLKDLQKAEDAADEALLRFGSNLRDFLKDAINIAPPSGDAANQGSTVLFESKDAQGKRVIHTSRFDAQLHVIHTTTENFVKDPTGAEFDSWTKAFDIDKKTADISGDLAKYPELRTTMEKLVPDQIPYADFWKRYYFLRHGIETAEARRRDLLKAASAEEEVGWDEDSEDEAAGASDAKPEAKRDRPTSTESSTTIHPPSAAAAQTLLKPSAPRKSNDEKSQADSDVSYDVVGITSGNPSQAPNSPKESRKGDDSDEEDWE
ncbi:BSD-domain-containing protein [Coniochaeta sp. PMI_546]|nr:BSD-domain-containing protein [Coniochaeta sp. PMI_546]